MFYTIVRIKRDQVCQRLSTDLASGVGSGGWEGVGDGRGYLINGRDAYHVTISNPVHLL